SALALQACGALARQGVPVLYVAGEESPEQVRLRADRLGMAEAGVLIVPETSAEAVIEALHATRPAAVVVDSIQTLHTARLESAAGSVGQVRESAALLVAECKASGVACFLIGHVTREGTLAGPRVLEHLVEIQALVSRSFLAMPRRTAIGLDPGRVALLLAVLEKRMRVALGDQDVFLNVAGGLRVDEPAADLAVVAAVASSARGRPLPADV